jgi:hypothetical protein
MSFARFELVEDVRIVHLDGCAADDDLGEAVAVLADHTGPTILDLDDVTLVGGHVDELVDELVERCDAVCVVARRRTARQILHRTGVAGRCAVFPSLRDALESLRSSDEAPGAGWAGAGVPG